ncbi:MAG: TonB-dependent receptor [Pseudomonadales bacterium]|nr:TonB-dependent receptor [Pseudomonadales bacterium]
MHHFHHKKISLLTAAVIATFYANGPLAAVKGLALEEIVVTAQKREQNLQDVPVAIQAVLGEQMRASGIEKMETLAPTIPALHVSEAFGGDQIFLRGLGPGVNFGFEQAVGQVVDGFFYGRSRFSRLQFLDLERVEVLKGPQGAIIGKNTTAGAINITTAKPTDELEGWLTLAEEFDGAEGESYEGAISGPLSDTIKARLALRFEDKDGFLENKVTGSDDQSRDDLAGRLSILFEPTDSFSALIQYGFSDIEREGRNIQPIHCTAQMVSVLAANGIQEDCKLNGTRSTTDKRNGVGGFEFQDTEASTFGLTLEWELENMTFTSLTGYAEYEYIDAGNATYTGIENFQIDIEEDYEQFSQEFRIASNGGGTVDYIVGLFYQEHELDSILDLNIGTLGPNTINRNRHVATEQDGETIAAFGQVTWHLSDQWDITLEGRYTKEDKDGASVQFPAALFERVQVPGPGSGGPTGVFNVHDVKGNRSESDFSPGLVLQWRPTDNAMYYLSLKKGFKGGGFDHQLVANQTDAVDGRFEFEEEEVVSVELGGKLDLADGAARLNFSIFRNEYDDLQVSTLIGPATFSVGNAASAITQGAEADLQWRVTEALTISATLALLDAEYDEFDQAPCSQFQIANALCASGFQDLSNKPLQYAPDYSYNITAEYIWPLSDRLELIGFVRVYGEDEKELALDLDPVDVQDSFTKVDARITLADVEGRWQVSLIGRNLDDETTMGFANDINFFNGSHFGITEAPRSAILQATFRF